MYKCHDLMFTLTQARCWQSLNMKIEKVLALPNVKILLQSQKEVRYSELTRLIKSRGALSNAFKELNEEELIQRRIDQRTRPVQSYYSLTKKGRSVAQELSKVCDSRIGEGF